jgi:hypothetical protein
LRVSIRYTSKETVEKVHSVVGNSLCVDVWYVVVVLVMYII